MAPDTNAWCERLGISVPSVAATRTHPAANTYALLIVTLLEHGRPMTLDQVALWFETSGVVSADEAYLSLARCRPARPPVYRDGDRYAIDPHDDELDRLAFRLGLRPPRVPRREPPPAPSRPLPSQRLGVDELELAFRNDANLMSWSAQRLALAILDAHARPMQPEEVVGFVARHTKWHKLQPGPTTFRRTGSAVAIDADGAWSIVPGASELVTARDVVRDAVERAHRQPVRSTPEQLDASMRAAEQRRRAHADELARLRRVIVHPFPRRAPRAVVLADVEQRELVTLIDDQLANLGAHLRNYDVLCGVEIRATKRELGLDSDDLRLAELGPPQKSIRLNRSGRTLTITTAMLIQGSCGISRPLGGDKQLHAYLARGQIAQLQRRLEADAMSLFALHQYGKTHGRVRLRWGFLDEMFPAPWHHRDEPTLYHLEREAQARSMGIMAVVGSAPGWHDPWARARRLEVMWGPRAHDRSLVDELGRVVDDRDVQLARLEAAVH